MSFTPVFTMPSQANMNDKKVLEVEKMEEGNLTGRKVTLMPASHGDMMVIGSAAGMGCGAILAMAGCCFGAVFLISGGIMKGVCPDADTAGCNQVIVNLAGALLITGGVLMGVAVCGVGTAACCGGALANDNISTF